MKNLQKFGILLAVLFLTPMASQSQEQESFIMDLTEYTIKYGHDAVFTEGVKKWNKCYKDNGGAETWNVWHRLQGKGNVYVLSRNVANWAAMETQDAAGKTCRSVALDFITPHIESTENNTVRSMPDISSSKALEDRTIVWVTQFSINDDAAFNDVLKEVTSVIKSKRGDNTGYWYRYMGGESGDYFVSSPYKDFAALDIEEESVWKTYEGVQGKKKTEDIRKKFRTSIDDSFSYTYTLSKDLSID